MAPAQQTTVGDTSYPYKIILCPVDFDAGSIAALGQARRLALAAGATLHVLHVVPLIPGAGEIADSIGPSGDESARQRLRELVERELAGLKSEIHIKIALHSDIAGGILATADEVKADLIVTATHGRAGLAHLLLGSVTEAVVRRAPCPVLAVRA